MFWFAVVAWLVMQPVNVWLACFCGRSLKQAALTASLLLVLWIGAAVLGFELAECPEGFVCTGG